MTTQAVPHGQTLANYPERSDAGISPVLFPVILVASDFSSASHTAFEAALQMCLASGAELRILHVFEYADEVPATGAALQPELAQRMNLAQQKLAELKRQAEQHGIPCRALLRAGFPAHIIATAIAEEHADLAILGTTAPHGFDRAIFGSTAETVLRQSTVPVLTLGPRAESAALKASPRPIVFATDFDIATAPAIRLAAVLARASGSPLHCVHVLPRSLQTNDRPTVIPTILTEALQQLVLESGVAPEHVVCTATFGSEVSNAVVQYARDHKAALIVLGVRQASLLASHTPPHIAFRIITEAPCPVLTRAFPAQVQHTCVAATCLE